MKPLDNIQSWIDKMNNKDTLNVLSQDEQIIWNNLNDNLRIEYLKSLLEKPIEFTLPVSIYAWYFRNKWGEALKTVLNKQMLNLLEIGSGSTDMLPQIMSRLFNHSKTKYTTINMNKELTSIFRNATNKLPIQIDIIEDAGQKIEDYFSGNELDVVVFEHSVNDIIQAMLAERNGIDTIDSDWFDVLPQMIEIVNKEYVSGSLESSVKNELLELIKSCLKVLKKDGYIIINHFQYQYDLNLGMNPELWENLLPIVRSWINDSSIGLEVYFDEFEPQWWMFIKKI